MMYQKFLDKWIILSELIEKFNADKDERNRELMNSYVDQNLTLVDDLLALNISQVRKLNKLTSANDIVCAQAKFSHEISKQLSIASKQFLDASLNNVTDYNEWLKAHSDHATKVR